MSRQRRDMSEVRLASVEDMIRMTFMNDGQKIDFKVLQALLLVLAKKLKMLERQVLVKTSGVQSFVSTVTMAISEVRIVAKGKKGKGKKDRDGPDDRDFDGSGGKRGGRRRSIDQGASKAQKTDSNDQLSHKRSKKRSSGEKDAGRRYSSDESAAKSAKSGIGGKGKSVDQDLSKTQKTDSDDESYKSSKKLKDVGRESAAKSAKSGIDGKGKSVDQDSSKTQKIDSDDQSYKSSKKLKDVGSESAAKSAKSGIDGKGKSVDQDSSKTQKTDSDDQSYKSSKKLKDVGSESAAKSAKSGIKEAGEQISTEKSESELLSSSSVSSDMQEKLIVVETIQSRDTGKDGKQKKSDGRGERDRLQSIVTREQFNSVLNDVINIQKRYGASTSGFKESTDMLKAMSKRYSITEPMAIMQLSARLENTERAIDTVMDTLKELENRTRSAYEDRVGQKTTKTEKKGEKGEKGEKQTKSKKDFSSKDKEARSEEVKFGDVAVYVTSETSPPKEAGSEGSIVKSEPPTKLKTYITLPELKQNVKQLETEIRKGIIYDPKDDLVAVNALKTSVLMETKLSNATDHLPDLVKELEKILRSGISQTSKADTDFSEVMINYQEELTNMAASIEVAIETMNETLANRVSDEEGIKDLINRMTLFQGDLSAASTVQRDLDYNEAMYQLDLEDIGKLIKLVQEVKSNRDEVEEAFKPKAGLSLLNGKVTKIEFEALQGQFQKTIAKSFIKYNSAENTWQKIIEDMFRSTNERATHFQLKSFQDNVASFIEKLNHRVDTMLEVCGEHEIGKRTKVINENKCLSCKTVAVGSGEPGAEGQSPKPFGGKEGEDVVKGKYFGDENGERHICYPTMPVRHALHPRSRICTRYCGHPVEVDEKDKEGIAKCMYQYYAKDRKIKLYDLHKRSKTDDTVPCDPCKHVKKNRSERKLSSLDINASTRRLRYADDEDPEKSNIRIDSRAIFVEDL